MTERYFLAGGLCASISHALACPIDVVKTRQQIVPSYRELSLPEVRVRARARARARFRARARVRVRIWVLTLTLALSRACCA